MGGRAVASVAQRDGANLLAALREDQDLEILGRSGPLTYRYAITRRGRDTRRRLLEVSGYVGPAPVALDAYAAMVNGRLRGQPPVTPRT